MTEWSELDALQSAKALLDLLIEQQRGRILQTQDHLADLEARAKNIDGRIEAARQGELARQRTKERENLEAQYEEKGPA